MYFFLDKILRRSKYICIHLRFIRDIYRGQGRIIQLGDEATCLWAQRSMVPKVNRRKGQRAYFRIVSTKMDKGEWTKQMLPHGPRTVLIWHFFEVNLV